MAVKKNGKRYLAELVDEREPGSIRLANKLAPHFKTCPGKPGPDVICRDVWVQVIKGRKAPIGTIGRVFWTGVGDYGERVGIKTVPIGTVYWLAMANVKRINELPCVQCGQQTPSPYGEEIRCEECQYENIGHSV